MSESVQRLRITFGADGPLRYVSHLDLMRVWERVCKRAHLPLSQSRGFSPRPKIALAAPLAVGMTSECELLDLLLDRTVAVDDALTRLNAQLTPGLTIYAVTQSQLKQPSLQSMLRAATYEVELSDPRPADEWRAAIAQLLAAESIPWSHQRGRETKEYDLRPLVLDLTLIRVVADRATLAMHLRNDERGAGRPEQVVRALGAANEPDRIHRTALELAEPIKLKRSA